MCQECVEHDGWFAPGELADIIGPSTSAAALGYEVKLSRAIEDVFKTLDAMSAVELAREIDKHRDDPKTLAILYAWNSNAS